MSAPSPSDLVLGLRRQDRRSIAKAITLLESTRPDHRALADELLEALLPLSGGALRVGISGVPGVGKSTFIEALGLLLVERGQRVAVLAVDPSSTITGGAILGDKTRMERLSVHPSAFVRPSPSSGTLGGVAAKTRESMLVFEAAGYDVILIETVGVGQSEIAAANMTDLFVLLQLPNAGDDLQAIKRGVMELADLVVVNKADLDPRATTRAVAQLQGSLGLFSAPPGSSDARREVPVLETDALSGAGVAPFWAAVERLAALDRASGALGAKRSRQSLAWMWASIEAGLRDRFRSDAAVVPELARLTAAVGAGTVTASVAARALLALFTNR